MSSSIEDIKGKREEVQNMKRVQEIYRHPYFQECLEKNQKAETTRVFCKHNMVHFQDVARLAYIFSMERGYSIKKEEIYVTALLHDIGKWQQYSDGTPHEKASACIADKILREAGFTEDERTRILTAILNHRKKGKEEKDPGHMTDSLMGDEMGEQLAEILYDADKISRACYMCPVEKECNWSEEKKNLNIIW